MMNKRILLGGFVLLVILALAGCARGKPETALIQPTLATALPSASPSPQPPAATPIAARPQASVAAASPTATTSSQVNVPLIGGSAATPEPDAPRAKGTLTIAEVTPPEPGSAEAIALVKEYLEALARGDTWAAYRRLRADYRARLPYEEYVKGYATVVDIEIHSIEAIKLGKNLEIVRVGMTIAARKQDEISYSDWWATFEVMDDMGKLPYRRGITSVSMEGMGLQ